MNSLEKSMAVSASGMTAQSLRLRLAAENIANADTPGYRRKTVTFRQSFDPETSLATVKAGTPALDPSPLRKIYDPSHPLADSSGYFEGSNVNLIIEIADARETQRSYEANMRMFDQARQMARDALSLLKR